MKNPYVVAILAATLAGVTPNSAAAQSGSKAGIKNVVLVHGAFADGSGWEAVAGILKTATRYRSCSTQKSRMRMTQRP